MPSDVPDGVIDVHTHMVPRSLPPALAGSSRPCIRCIDAQHAQLVAGDRVVRELDSLSWDVDARIALMDEEEVAVQVVSPMPELLTHWLPMHESHEIAQRVNDAIAGMVGRRPDRFVGLGMASLQDPQKGARDLETLREIGLSGVEVATDVGGRLLGDARFEPFLRAADDLRMRILVHPVRPPATGLGRVPAADVLVGYPLQTGKAVVDLVFADVPRKFPHLKLIFAHGGGVAPTLLGRCSQGWRAVPSVRGSLGADPLVVARSFYFDTLVYDPRALQYLVAIFDAAQLLVGSDFPFALRETRPGHMLAELVLDEPQRSLIRRDNARMLFGLDTAKRAPPAS